MKYFSEKLNQTFDTEKECLEAEKKEQTNKQIVEAQKSKHKKELANKIEDADKKLNEANKLYDIAKQKAADILEKSNKEVKEILEAAEKEVKKANEEKLDAILAFNKEFGEYSVTYTGEKAANEYNNILRSFQSDLRRFFNNFWF